MMRASVPQAATGAPHEVAAEALFSNAEPEAPLETAGEVTGDDSAE